MRMGCEYNHDEWGRWKQLLIRGGLITAKHENKRICELIFTTGNPLARCHPCPTSQHIRHIRQSCYPNAQGIQRELHTFCVQYCSSFSLHDGVFVLHIVYCRFCTSMMPDTMKSIQSNHLARRSWWKYRVRFFLLSFRWVFFLSDFSCSSPMFLFPLLISHFLPLISLSN